MRPCVCSCTRRGRSFVTPVLQHARATCEDIHPVDVLHLLGSWILARDRHHSSSGWGINTRTGLLPSCFSIFPPHVSERACHPEGRRPEGPAFESFVPLRRSFAQRARRALRSG